MNGSQVTIEIVEGDVLEVAADVLALKYAQHYYGSDQAVSSLLIERGLAAKADLEPAAGSHVWVDPRGALPSRNVLFVGVPPLIAFGYSEIEAFSRQVVSIVAAERPEARHIVITLHGPGYGLDEIEALHAEVRGVLSAVTAHDAPERLNLVSIADRNPERVRRLRTALADLTTRPPQNAPLPDTQPSRSSGAEALTAADNKTDPYNMALDHDIKLMRPLKLRIPRRKDEGSGEVDVALDARASANLQSMEQVERKPRAFVAMPYSTEMLDVYNYGIYEPVRRLGYVCERIDLVAFTGDILSRVKSGIESADIVIADLTNANPNVYLEVGYAWAKDRPTLLVANKKDELKFDVQGQRCLKYENITELDRMLTAELKKLRQAGEQA